MMDRVHLVLSKSSHSVTVVRRNVTWDVGRVWRERLSLLKMVKNGNGLDDLSVRIDVNGESTAAYPWHSLGLTLL